MLFRLLLLWVMASMLTVAFVFCVCSSIFGHEGQDAEDVVYVNWLSMVRAGLLGLEFYTPESKSWRQVICLLTQLRFSITCCLSTALLGLVCGTL